MSKPRERRATTATHWGTYHAEVRDGRVVAMHPIDLDLDPSPIGDSIPGAIDDGCRIREPMVRAGWLEGGPVRPALGRGGEPFVPVRWETALELVAGEIERVRGGFGNRAIFGGSYGWSSPGRFHHPQSQLHRFLNQAGGYTAAKNTYSFAAGEVLLPYVVGTDFQVFVEGHSWPVIAEHTRLVVMFGGMPLKNTQVENGGLGRHTTREWLLRCRRGGVEFVNLSPVREDAAAFLEAQWLAPRPNTDTAIMLGIAHTLFTNGLHDAAFLDQYCRGFERFVPYLMGESDGVPKTAGWAGSVSGLDAQEIRSLAHRMASQRTFISCSLSLQRADHGEQPIWMAVTLAAMLGQIGLPGGGFGIGHGALHGVGNPAPLFRWAALHQGENPVSDFIPVARIADMLLEPGRTIDYDGQKVTFPDIRLVYWAGGNPFHHHQDLNRLLRAWQQPETIVVHERSWNAIARHADIVLPATTQLKRNDIAGCGHRRDGFLIANRQVIEPIGEARNDHEIFAGIAERLGFGQQFTEGRNEMDWLRHLYNISRQRAAEQDLELPEFDAFWSAGHLELPHPSKPNTFLADFRHDPSAHPLTTPSGKIEIFSETIDRFGYDDCPAHPTWIPPREWLGAPAARRFPLHLISNQPKTRLHSQFDNGAYSRAAKVAGREPVRLHPEDAAAGGINDGDVVRLFNDRGACLAGAVVADDVRRGWSSSRRGLGTTPKSRG